MALASTVGLTGASMRESGSITRCMDVVFIHGKTVENTKESIRKTKRMALARTPGPMAKNMWVSGEIANDMEKVHE